MPGRSFACCICFNCRASSPAAPAEGETVGASELLCEEGVPRWGVCAAWEDIVGGIGAGVEEIVVGRCRFEKTVRVVSV